MLLKNFLSLVGPMLKTKSGKVGAGVVGGGLSLGLVFAIYSWTVDGVNARAIESEKRVIVYVDGKHQAALAEFRAHVSNLENNQNDMKKILFRMDKRLYEATRR